MTGKEICEAYARFKGVPADQVEAWAERFWEAIPSGELHNVAAAYDEMVAAGFLTTAGGEVISRDVVVDDETRLRLATYIQSRHGTP